MRMINLIFLKVNTLTVKEMVMGDIFGQTENAMKENGWILNIKEKENSS